MPIPPSVGIRKGDWKLIKFWVHGDAQLYNLADISEQNDLSKKRESIKAELSTELAKWRKQVRAAMAPLREQKVRKTPSVQETTISGYTPKLTKGM